MDLVTTERLDVCLPRVGLLPTQRSTRTMLQRAAATLPPKRPLTEVSVEEPVSKSAAKRAAKRVRVAAATPVEIPKQQVSLKDCDAELFGGPAVVRPKYADEKEVSEGEARAFMKTHEITVNDATAPPPCTTLSGAPFPKPLVKLLTTQGFRIPSAVQAASWPLAMNGRDVLAVAKTGAGKTLGYLLPALTRCHESLARSAGKPSAGKPRCLVMAPTRELVIQIKGVAAKYGAPLGCRAVAVYGGTPKWEQAAELQAGCEIVIATPGRLLDLLDLYSSQSGGPRPSPSGGGRGGPDDSAPSKHGPATSLAHCTLLVLDEADAMLELGHEQDICTTVLAMPKGGRRQTLLFTATWSKMIERLASELLARTHCRVTIGSSSTSDHPTANRAVTQVVHVIDPSEKWAAFVKLLAPFKVGRSEASARVLVFANTRADVQGIGEHCMKHQLSSDTVSRDRTQEEREDVLRRFRSGAVHVLIATDVAARGLDVQGIKRVINFDFPSGAGGATQYIPRIGRTGRAGATGQADTLFTTAESKTVAAELARILLEAGQVVPDKLAAMARKGGWKPGSKGIKK